MSVTETDPPPFPGTTEDILVGYIDRPNLSVAMRCSERTLARYEKLPDGLPYLSVGGRKLYRIEAVKAWIARRERQPNPTRRRMG
jgi:hypothetical protein